LSIGVVKMVVKMVVVTVLVNGHILP